MSYAVEHWKKVPIGVKRRSDLDYPDANLNPDDRMNTTIQGSGHKDWEYMRIYLDEAESLGIKTIVALPFHFNPVDKAFEYNDVSSVFDLTEGHHWIHVPGADPDSIYTISDTTLPDPYNIYKFSADSNLVLRVVSDQGTAFAIEYPDSEHSLMNGRYSRSFCFWIKPEDCGGFEDCFSFTVTCLVDSSKNDGDLPEEPSPGKALYPAMYDSLRAWIEEKESDCIYHHPRMLVFYAVSSRYLPTFDEEYSSSYSIGGTDIYPVRYDGDTGSSTAELFAGSNSYELVPAGIEVGMDQIEENYLERLIFVAQSFDHTNSDIDDYSGQYRMPYYLEQRYMAYSAIIHGARGLIWFYFPNVCLPERADGDSVIWDTTYLDSLIMLIDEMKPLLPTVMSGLISDQVICSDEDLSDTMYTMFDRDINYIFLEKSNGEHYLFSVNDSRISRKEGGDRPEVTFYIPDSIWSDSVEVIGEARTITIEKKGSRGIPNSFSDTFDMFDVNLYAFNDPDITIDVDSCENFVQQGDTLHFHSSVMNHTSDTLTVDITFTGILDSIPIPSSFSCLPQNPVKDLTLLPCDTIGGDCWIWVPREQDPGDYILKGTVEVVFKKWREYEMTDSDSCSFIVLERLFD